MVTAIAGLESGVVTPTERINDTGVYTDAGYPPARCWYYNSYHVGHGLLNVSGAIQKSCNYYFYEAGRRMGIETLAKYASYFGLDRKTGVELLSEATENIGTHEVIDHKEEIKKLDIDRGFLEYKKLAVNVQCKTYYPNGYFEGFLVPHEETITIAKSLEVKEGKRTVYRPTVMFIYSPCDLAKSYLENSKVNNHNQDYEVIDNKTIVRGHVYPNDVEIVYQEKIKEGTEYVGVLVMGDHFNPVWVGNRVEMNFLYKHKKGSYWQSPTITPVSMSALAAVCWMIKNKDKGGIYFPDDIPDYHYIIKKAEKYISKTLYKTFDKNEIDQILGTSTYQSKEIIVK